MTLKITCLTDEAAANSLSAFLLDPRFVFVVFGQVISMYVFPATELLWPQGAGDKDKKKQRSVTNIHMMSFLRSNVASIVGRAFRRIGVDELSVSAAWRRQR